MKDETKKTQLTPEEKSLFAELMPEDLDEIEVSGVTRRHFMKLMGFAAGGALISHLLGAEQLLARPLETPLPSNLPLGAIENGVEVAFKVNDIRKKITVDSRMTLLDTLRERLALTGSKKGCDHGQCGACTVIVDDRRVLSCLTLAATCQGKSVKTIEGLATANELHPMQAAFLKHDGFQCGFCTSGQICSAVALMKEANDGHASYVTKNVRKPSSTQLSAEEIRERMSGNICRCGAYPNIVLAIQEVNSGVSLEQTWQFVGEYKA